MLISSKVDAPYERTKLQQEAIYAKNNTPEIATVKDDVVS